jgi:hypothetical protein
MSIDNGADQRAGLGKQIGLIVKDEEMKAYQW